LDEMKIVSVSRDEAMEAAASPTMDYQEKLNKATKFRLVIDALATSHEPLWAEMEDEVMSSFSLVKKAAVEAKSTEFHSNLNVLLSNYNLIYPSMRIDISADDLQKLDTGIRFLEGYSAAVPASKQDREEFEALEAQFQEIFDGIEEDEADPSLWWVIISTGSIIVLTLSYVGWRKYKGDQEAVRKRSSELKD
jgi:sporulation protein YpjB